MATHILGVSGKKRAGKDTIADHLVAQHGFTKVSFADAVKETALAINPIIEPYGVNGGVKRLSYFVGEFGWEKAKDHPEVRGFLQRYATEAVRSLMPDFWLDVAMKVALGTDGRVVIPDVRFPNEAAEIQDHGMLIRVNRPGLDFTDTHLSEIALDDWPHDDVIENDGTIEDLHGKIDQWIR